MSLDSSAGTDKPEEAAAQSPEQFWSEKRVADLTKVLRDDIVLENRISCLDVHDVIHAYCSETTDRVWDVLVCEAFAWFLIVEFTQFPFFAG